MEERRKAFNARESLQGEYPTPEQRHREVNQAFAIVILSCMFLVVTVAWIVNMKWDSNPAPVISISGSCRITYTPEGDIIFSRTIPGGKVIEDLHYYSNGRIER